MRKGSWLLTMALAVGASAIFAGSLAWAAHCGACYDADGDLVADDRDCCKAADPMDPPDEPELCGYMQIAPTMGSIGGCASMDGVQGCTDGSVMNMPGHIEADVPPGVGEMAVTPAAGACPAGSQFEGCKACGCTETVLNHPGCSQ